MLYKNVASQKLAVYAYTVSTGAAKTGDAANITAYVSLDFGVPAATDDANPTELDATNMPGWYVFDLTQAETNAEVLILAAKSATSGVACDQIQLLTQDAAISSRLAPAVAGRTLTVAATGEASANVTHRAGAAVAAADEDGNDPVNTATIGAAVVAAMNDNPPNVSRVTGDVLGGVQGDVQGGVQGDLLGSIMGDMRGNVQGSVGALDMVARQQVRDAMKLASSAGDPAAGSIDDKLDDLAVGGGGGGDAGAVWAYPSRTLTAMPAATTDGTAAGSITRRRGDSWSIGLTVGAVTGYTSLWFTVKRNTNDADNASLLQIKLNSPSAADGLLYVNGTAAANAALGAITVSNAGTGAIVIALDETVTDDLAPGVYYYDIQVLVSGVVSTLDNGTFAVTADVTRSVA